MSYPNIINVAQVIEGAKHESAGLPNGSYVPARPLGFQSWRYRLKAALLVFNGKADAGTSIMNNDPPDYRSEFAQYLYDETHPFGDLSPAVGIANSILIVLAGLVLGFICAYLFAA